MNANNESQIAAHKFATSIEQLTDRIAELTDEVARYKTDAERLDWCEANADHVSMPYYEDGKFNVTWLFRRAEGVCTSQFNTLREAIDFVRSALRDLP